MGPSARRALLMTSLMAAVALAGCSASGGPVHATQPSWESGYAWTYLHTVEESYVWDEDGERENETEHATWREVREVLNTTNAARGEPFYVVGSQQEGELGGRQVLVIRQRDLDALPFSMRTGQSCSDRCEGQFELDEVNTSTPTFLDFPLERGKRWGGVFTPDHSDVRVVYQAEVDGAYAVATGLGTMEAARISISYQLADAGKVRQEMLAEAKEEGYQVDEFRFSMSEHQLIYYSADYQSIVRSDTRWEETFKARGTDPDGQRFDYSGAESGRATTVVEGARLLPRPERGPADVAAFLQGELDLRDPTGQSVGGAGYKLGVSPAKAVVNAGIGQSVDFAAAVDGDMPEGHTLGWRLVDEAGATVTSGQGASFAAAPSAPGRYTVELESSDGNRSVAAAGATLVADWHETHVVDCGPVSFYSECVDEPVPVHPGARSVFVRVQPQDTAPGLADEMYLVDSAGTEIHGTQGPTGWTVELSPLGGHLVDGDPWTLRFNRGVAALSEAEVEVQVMYSAAPVDRPTHQAWPMSFARPALPRTIA